ncbi:MAG: hypothetical protein J1F25_06435, partial [Prevotellaceae bacterium]|nr:hypothetical protein [Prevotellaceae bacterium]
HPPHRHRQRADRPLRRQETPHQDVGKRASSARVFYHSENQAFQLLKKAYAQTFLGVRIRLYTFMHKTKNVCAHAEKRLCTRKIIISQRMFAQLNKMV